MKNKLMKSSSAESDHAIDKIPFKELYESVIKTNGDRNQGVIGKLAQNASSDTKINTTGLMSKYVPNGSQFNRRKSNYLMSSVGNLSGVKTPQTSSYAYIDDTNAVNGVDNSLYSSLVDSIFLLGPSKHDIYLLLAAEQTSKKPSNTEFNPFSDSNTSHSTPPLPEKDAPSRSDPQLPLESKLKPSILYMTQCDNPHEMLSLLPSYCFPSDATVKITGISHPSVSATMRGERTRRNEDERRIGKTNRKERIRRNEYEGTNRKERIRRNE